jgi:glutathione synthase/RimK-type ligase-like ATP-grasp enzyme
MIGLQQNSNSFFQHWKEYCDENNIPYKVVNCNDNDIVKQLEDCDCFMWHHNHANPIDTLFAKQLLYSLETAGKKVFPEFFSSWHFDDKLGQKYLFESTGILHVPTFVFYEKEKALNWAMETVFPKVFKLRRGAGSRNVWLIKTRKEAVTIINKAFARGFRQYDAWGGVKESTWKWRIGKGSIKEIAKAIAHIFFPIQLERSQGRERGYVYFQDFIPANSFDIRVVIVGKRAFAIKRLARSNDFRASGSGLIQYEKEHFDISLIDLSFKNAAKLNAYCAAFDYIFFEGKALVIEVSYAFNKKAYYDCPGYWSSDLVWNEGNFNPYGWMIEDLLSLKNASLDLERSKEFY